MGLSMGHPGGGVSTGCGTSGPGNINPILIWPQLACSDGLITLFDPAPATDKGR
jgi:hypothetical protein